MKTYKLLVLDIDGTLTNSKKEITPRTLQALLDLQEKGTKVVLASGRPTPGIQALAKQLKLDVYGSYILSYNGAKIIDCKTGHIVYQSTLPKQFIPKLYEAAMQYQVGIISYEDDCIIAGTAIDPYIEKEAQINGIAVKQVDHFCDYIDFDVNKCLMTGEGTYLATVEEKMKKAFGDALSIYRSEPYFLEIMPQNIDKANSLQKLLEYLGYTKDDMVCCGDGYNDISMIRYAGLGVAMENAQAQVKEAADYITRSNDDDGIVHLLEQIRFA